MIILKRAGRPGQQLVGFFQSNGPNWVAVSTKKVLMTMTVISNTFPIWRFSQKPVP